MRELREGGGGLSLKAKRLNLPLLLHTVPIKKLAFSVPLLIIDHVLVKKGILPKLFSCGVHSQLHNLDLFEKREGAKPFNTKQWSAGLSPKIMPWCLLPTKMSPPLMLLCCTHQVCGVPCFSKPWGWGVTVN